jgi:hypothetical protein
VGRRRHGRQSERRRVALRAALGRHLELVLRQYRRQVRALFEHLSQSTTRVAVGARDSA